MDGYKATLSSKTVWANIFGIVALGLTALFGITVDPATQATVVDGTTAAIGGAITAASAVGSIIARIAATKRIGKAS